MTGTSKRRGVKTSPCACTASSRSRRGTTKPCRTKSRPGGCSKTRGFASTPIPVPHGSWPEAFGYRFQSPDRTIVISGDTRPSDAIAEACSGCDVLMHEVYPATRSWRAARPSGRRITAPFTRPPRSWPRWRARRSRSSSSSITSCTGAPPMRICSGRFARRGIRARWWQAEIWMSTETPHSPKGRLR